MLKYQINVLICTHARTKWRGAVCYIGKKVRTAIIEAVHPKDVSSAHLSGSANGYIGVGDGNDGWLPVPGEGKPMVQIHNSENSFKLYTYHHALLFNSSARTTCSFPNEHWKLMHEQFTILMLHSESFGHNSTTCWTHVIWHTVT